MRPMSSRVFSPLDGLVTAMTIAGAIVIIGEQRGAAIGDSGARIFYATGVLLALSIVVTATGRRSPPGVIGAIHGRPERPPSPVIGRDSWFDRFATLDNAWLIAALALFVISLLPPFLSATP